MKREWINPKIIIGNTATGNYYFHRPQIVETIWEELAKGNHVLLAAPRRVGKSSVMKYMIENPPDGHRCIFENIQGINSEKQLFKRFYELVILCLNRYQQGKKWVQDFFKERKITEVSLDGVKIDKTGIDYINELNHVLPLLNDKKLKVVLFIDELPEVLHALNKAGKKEEAIFILKNIRRWRQEDQFKNISFVLAGSVGIHHVVQAIEGRTSDLNDPYKIYFDPLGDTEAREYIAWATNNGATVKYNDEQTSHLLDKISYCLPYFINLMLDEINKSARKKENPDIDQKDIDTAFDTILKNNDHFREWKNRLFDYMPAGDAIFLNQVLIHIAHKDAITRQKLYDLAIKHNKTNDYMDRMDDLEKDGYIIESGEQFVFVSPFLKAFWKRNNPVYNENE